MQPEKQSPDGNIIVSFKLTNTGSRAGDEMPQLYIHQEVSPVTTWEKRLCGFDRVHLNADESKMVIMTIAPECLAIWNREMKRLVRKSTRLNSSHLGISYAVFCLKKKKKK